MPELLPIVLDLDGVVLQTNQVKLRAMLSLFDNCPAEQSEISEYILRNGGVRRDIKIAHILRAYPRRTATDDLEKYLSAYATKLEDDSPPDRDAAIEAEASFVAVVFERDNFAGVPVVKLPDFTSPERVQYCIKAAGRDDV